MSRTRRTANNIQPARMPARTSEDTEKGRGTVPFSASEVILSAMVVGGGMAEVMSADVGGEVVGGIGGEVVGGNVGGTQMGYSAAKKSVSCVPVVLSGVAQVVVSAWYRMKFCPRACIHACSQASWQSQCQGLPERSNKLMPSSPDSRPSSKLDSWLLWRVSTVRC